MIDFYDMQIRSVLRRQAQNSIIDLLSRELHDYILAKHSVQKPDIITSDQAVLQFTYRFIKAV